MADEIIGIEIIAAADTRPIENVGDELKEVRHEVRRLNEEQTKQNATQKVSVTTGNKFADSLLNSKNKAEGLGWALKAVKIPAFVALLKTGTAAVMNLSAGLAAVIGNMSRMGGLVGLLPGVLLGIGGIFGTFKLATSGIAEAVKTMTKQGATVAEVAAATKDLPAPAKAFAEQLARWQKYLKPLKATAAGAVLPAFSAGLQRLTHFLPTANRLVRMFGHVISDTVTSVTQMVTSKGFMSDIETMGGSSARAFHNIGQTLAPILSIFRHIGVAAGPTLEALSRVIRLGVQTLELRVAGLRADGRMSAFFARSLVSARQWGRIIVNLSATLFHFFRAGGSLGESMADSLEKITKRWRDWTGSATGTSRMRQFFDNSKAALHEMALLLRDVWHMFGRIGTAGNAGVVPLIHAIRVQLLPSIEKMTTGMSDKLLPALVKFGGSIVKIMSFTSFQPLVEAVVIIGNVLDVLLRATSALPGIHGFVTAMMSLGLALKTIKLVGSISGLSSVVTLFAGPKGAAAGGAIWRMTNGFKAMKAAQAAGGAMTFKNAMYQGQGIAGGGGIMGSLGALMAGPQAIPVLIGLAVAALVAGLVLMYLKVKWFHDAINAIGRFFVRLFTDYIPAGIRRGANAVVAAFRWLIDRAEGVFRRSPIGGLIVGASRLAHGDFGGAASAYAGGLTGGLIGGDTTGRRARGGDLARSLAMHGSIDASVPGRRAITNVFHAAKGGPDHPAGRAFDLVGSGLQSYASKLRSMGGFAEFHGAGAGRHLHGVYGDTVLSHAGRRPTSGGSNVLSVNGPLIGYVSAPTVEVGAAAVERGIEKWLTDRERRG